MERTPIEGRLPLVLDAMNIAVRTDLYSCLSNPPESSATSGDYNG